MWGQTYKPIAANGFIVALKCYIVSILFKHETLNTLERLSFKKSKYMYLLPSRSDKQRL